MSPTAVAVPTIPYCGIHPFRYRDHAIFFARTQETQRLAILVSVYRGVLLYGDSGSGKSSLVNAGLLPELMAKGFSPERVRVQPRAMEELVIERISLSEDDPEAMLPSLLAGEGDTGERTVLSIDDFVGRVGAACDGQRPLLIFDQFEEIVTLFDEAAASEVQSALVQCLLGLIQGTLPVKLLFAFRDDYLGRLRELMRPCPELIDQALRLTPPSVEALPTIISGPFERYPDHFSHPLSSTLCTKLGAILSERFGTGELSLSEVQIVCLRLWQSTDPEALLEAKGPQGLLEDYLGEALDEMPPRLRPAAIALLSEMITAAGTRNVISAEDLFARVRDDGVREPQAVLTEALARLSESRLVRRERRRDLDLYEITSEFLVPWISRRRDELRRVQERRRERHRIRILGSIAAGLLLVVAAVVALAIWALAQRSQARTQATAARSLALAADAQANTDRLDVRLALALAALAPYRGGRAAPVAARSQMIGALTQARTEGLHGFLDTGSAPIDSLAFDPHTGTLAVGGNGGTVRLWSPVTRRLVATLASSERTAIGSLAFSPDGRTLAAGSANGIVRLWDRATDRASSTMPIGRRNAVAALAFSPDGRLLAVGGADGGIRIWNVTRHRRVGPVLFPSASRAPQAITTSGIVPGVAGIAFSPDGRTLVAGEGNPFNPGVFLWRVRDLRQLGFSVTERELVGSIALSRDGRTVAVGGVDGVELWALTGRHRRLRKFSTGGNVVTSVAFSADGRALAAAFGFGARVWRVSDAGRIAALPTRANTTVSVVAFGPTGHELAAGGSTGIVTLSDPAMTGLPGVALPAVVFGSQVGAYSPDGHLVAVGDDSGGVRVWTVPGDVLAARLSTHDNNGVATVGFSRSGRQLLAVDSDGRVTRWSTGSWTPLAVMRAVDRNASDTAVSPDQRKLATVDGGRFAHLWSIPDGRRVGSLDAGSGATLGRVAFAPSGGRLAVAEDHKSVVLVWKLGSPGQHPLRLPGPYGSYSGALGFSPGGDLIAAMSSDGSVRLWNASTGRRAGAILTAGGSLTHVSLGAAVASIGDLAFSSDGHTLLTFANGEVRLWDLATSTQLGQSLADGDASNVIVDPHRTSIALVGQSEVQIVGGLLWTGFDQLHRTACGLAGNPLDRVSWTQYAPGIPYERTCEVAH